MENLNSLPPFYIGQKVVYITGISMPKNSIHKITNVIRFTCGCYVVSIGRIDDGVPYRQCSKCNAIIGSFTSKEELFEANSFRPLEESPFPSLTYSKVVEKESELISLN